MFDNIKKKEKMDKKKNKKIKDIYKEIKKVNINKTESISLYEIKAETDEKTILIIGVFHGEEPQGEYLINKFFQTECKNLKNRLLVVPCLNPTGRKRNQRQNENGIDLNRNFPTENWKLVENKEYYGGKESASEIETRFIIEILKENKIDAILTIHAPFGIVNYDGPAKELAEKISEITGYKVEADIGYPTPGSFGNYAGVERNIPTITLELPENETNESLWQNNKNVFEYLAYEY